MASGRIRDFSKPDPERETSPQILSAVSNQGAQVSQEPQPIEVRVHEETIREGQSNVRNRIEVNPEVEIKLRTTNDPQAWDRVKKGEDE